VSRPYDKSTVAASLGYVLAAAARGSYPGEQVLAVLILLVLMVVALCKLRCDLEHKTAHEAIRDTGVWLLFVVTLSQAVNTFFGLEPVVLDSYRALLSAIAQTAINVFGLSSIVTLQVMMSIVNAAVLVGTLSFLATQGRARRASDDTPTHGGFRAVATAGVG